MRAKPLVLVIAVLAAAPVSAEIMVDTTWVMTYDGPASGDDCAQAIVVDEAGTVCVTAYISGSSSDDYGTIKYHPIQAGNANCDAIVDIADVVFLVNHLFRGGPAPNCYP